MLHDFSQSNDTYEYRKTYLDILNRWKIDDFSAVVDDHNLLMVMQKPTPPEGFATGIASREEEIHYVFQVFDKELE